jgi:pseudo-rSAM protein
LDKVEIFQKQVLNTYNYGNLIISSEGKIYSNINNAPTGDIETPLIEIIKKEINSNLSWFKIRNMEPCNNCVYQWLCPSPSDYEIAINKPNLCHIKN